MKPPRNPASTKSLSKLELNLLDADGDGDAPLTDESVANLAFVAEAATLADRLTTFVEIWPHQPQFGLAPVILEDVEQIVGDAKHLMGLAVVRLRAAHVSWEAIGEQLGITKQSAQERYAEIIRYFGEVVSAGHASWVHDPNGTAAKLDSWRLYHQQNPFYRGSSPTRVPQPVSQGLRRQSIHLQLMCLDGESAELLLGSFPTPVEVTEQMAKICERKADLYDRLAGRLAEADPTGKQTTGFFTEGAARERSRAEELRANAAIMAMPMVSHREPS